LVVLLQWVIMKDMFISLIETPAKPLREQKWVQPLSQASLCLLRPMR